MNKNLKKLDLRKIKKYVKKIYLKKIKEFSLFKKIDSTNNYLLQLASSSKNIHICLSEQQTRGKGRFNRQWLSPFGANIYFSMLWPFAKNLSSLSGLSLVVAIAVADALAEIGIKKDIGLKWPNDIWWRDRKLVGVLIELTSEAYSMSRAVIGIGINVNMPEDIGNKIDQPWIDIRQIIGKVADRNKIAGLLINHIIKNILIFQEQNLTPFLKRWRKLDLLRNKEIKVITPSKKIRGIARGIDKNGYLLLEDKTGQIQVFSIGEVSVNPHP